MNSFRFKLGILLAVIAGAFIVSQVVYLAKSSGRNRVIC